MKLSSEEIKAMEKELKTLERASKLSIKQHARKIDLDYALWCRDFDNRSYRAQAKKFKETNNTIGVAKLEWGKYTIEL